MSVDYYVAIPSYKRSNIIQKCSLQFCIQHGVLIHKIHIFVATDDPEVDAYLAIRQTYPDIHIHVDGPIGLHHMRNYISRFFPDGTLLLCMDDDIKDMYFMEEDLSVENKMSSKRYPLYNLTCEMFQSWIETAFTTLMLGNARLFGVYPVRNGYFMKDLPYLTTDLRFCVGAFWGCVNDRSILINIEEKEDFERTLLYYEKHDSVHRYNHITIRTDYYTTPGGMQARPRSRAESSRESCQYLVDRFPKLCRYHRTKSSGISEVKLVKRT